jgi:DNA-binding transcriptional regulator LsrR (DeoR family)
MRRLEGLEQEVADAYHAGATLRDLASRYHCSKETVQRALLALGVEPRPRGQRLLLAAHDDAIAAAYTAGDTTQQLADRYGVSSRTIRDSLVRSGTPTRPLGRPKRA